MAMLSLAGRAVAASGVTENGYDIGDRWVSHIIDPVPGLPTDTGLLSVSVLTQAAMQAFLTSPHRRVPVTSKGNSQVRSAG